ncbi:GNAT family N-acetyltransferase [Oscillatoria sp. FACHB-1407]|uniref:GNAT family N-acetyltransferase n=1 Tax=Oscillatoria sp. FACHB-1407 TaxID=2692847 RepID=UPI001685B9BE|nr:GNAT family N-acetyltransferase [Oscillatoria sp. FACHB-1407]MBD2460609.1 GNAT family N-acetyltransferase [Oscillatoria sp. FACHB-1407]
MQKTIDIREASPGADALIAAHFYRLWQDNAIPGECIYPNWLDLTLKFIDRARRELSFKAFVAEVDGQIVGSASCQLFEGLYPQILTPQARQYGYIWGVYVEPPYRRQGIAQQLTKEAIAHLKSLGCTRAILHASPSGKSVYEHLGFSTSNEMRLDLV